MVYGVYFVWLSLGYAEDSGGAVGLLARKVWAALEWCYLDGCPSLFDVVHLVGEEQPAF